MTTCNHDWFPPLGRKCPDCLWEEAASSRVLGTHQVSERKDDLQLAQQAVREAALLVGPNPEPSRIILRVARVENNWKALKVAREMRQLQLRQEQRR